MREKGKSEEGLTEIPRRENIFEIELKEGINEKYLCVRRVIKRVK